MRREQTMSVPAGAQEALRIEGRPRQLFFREIEQKTLVCPTPEEFRDVRRYLPSLPSVDCRVRLVHAGI